jgi:hypothetical protein
VHLECSDAEVRAWALNPPWSIPDPPLLPSRSSSTPHHQQYSHDRHRSGKQHKKREPEEDEPTKENARWIQHEFEKEVLEAQAWRTPLTLPPFLPILYSDYVLAERRTIWRYDAKDRSMMEDRETREAWATVKVRSVVDRMGDGTGEGEAAAEEAMKKDGRYLKTLVRNLAEKGAVSGLALALDMSLRLIANPALHNRWLMPFCRVDLACFFVLVMMLALLLTDLAFLFAHEYIRPLDHNPVIFQHSYSDLSNCRASLSS